MPYDHDYVCMMKQPVLCELCNKSFLSLLVMYNYAGGKGGAYDYEANEAK